MHKHHTTSNQNSYPSIFVAVACFLALSLLTVWIFAVQTQPAAADPIDVGLIIEGAAVENSLWDEVTYQGLLRAQDDFGVMGTVYTATSDADYGPNLEQCVADGNELCISTSFLTQDAISETASLFPEVDFAIVDVSFDQHPPNLRGINFQTDEAAYLAGALAAMMSDSGVLGVIGGMDIPPVTIFTDGFQHGASCVNPDITTIITFTNNFGDQELGANVAQEMIQQGADVIFPPAGPLGYGAILTATQSGVWGIGFDVDLYYSLFMSGTITGSEYLLTSVQKNLDEAVYLTIMDVISGTFTSGTKMYNLAEGGVGFAPYHETDGAIPIEVKRKIEWLKQGISSGWLDINGGCPNQLFLPFLQD